VCRDVFHFKVRFFGAPAVVDWPVNSGPAHYSELQGVPFHTFSNRLGSEEPGHSGKVSGPATPDEIPHGTDH